MIKSYDNQMPVIDATAMLAYDADIIGQVELGKNVNIWYHAVLRGDDNSIKVGENTNVQDGCIVHTTKEFATTIGKNVTIGHGAILHGCLVGDNSLIGMGAIVLDGAKIGSHTLIGAGCLVPPGKEIPSGVLAVGSPAKVVRDLSEEEIRHLEESPKEYIEFAKKQF